MSQLPCYKRPSVYIPPIVLPTQPPPFRALADVSHLEQNLHAIRSMFPDISFNRKAIEKRQKFKWRAMSQIERARKQICEWESQLAEYQYLDENDNKYVDLKRQLKIALSDKKSRFDSDDEDEHTTGGQTDSYADDFDMPAPRATASDYDGAYDYNYDNAHSNNNADGFNYQQGGTEDQYNDNDSVISIHQSFGNRNFPATAQTGNNRR